MVPIVNCRIRNEMVSNGVQGVCVRKPLRHVLIVLITCNVYGDSNPKPPMFVSEYNGMSEICLFKCSNGSIVFNIGRLIISHWLSVKRQ